MATCTLEAHWKFKRLTRAIGTPIIAWGLLEALWWAAYRLADPYIGNADDIADALDWPRVARLIGRPPDPTDLVALLTSCGFLDEPTPGRCLVHDLWDHAPPFVRLRWIREHPNKTPPWQDPTRTKATSGVRPGREGKGREEERAAAAPQSRAHAEKPNSDLLAALGHDLDDQTFDSSADAKEALKVLAAQKGVPYDSDSITAALRLMGRSQRPLWVSDARSPPIRTAGPMKRRA